DVMRNSGALAALALFGLGIGCSGQNPGSSVMAEPGGHGPAVPECGVDSVRLLRDLQFLSSHRLARRAVGTRGNTMAREYIVEAYHAAGLESFEDGYSHDFHVSGPADGGVNVVGFVRGTSPRERYIVVSAHYDHLGTRNGVVYPGADDNASGTAAML